MASFIQNNQIIAFNAPTHLPTKLTSSNFSVWRMQLQSALIGHNLLGHINGSCSPLHLQSLTQKTTQTIENPNFIIWYRQDQFILNAILGSCIEEIQSHISTVSSSQEAWTRLSVLFANKSRSRIMSLKEHLHDNPRGTRSITQYMQDVRATTDALAIADTLVVEDDLILHVLKGVGDEFDPVAAAVRVRDTHITFDELFDKLEDFERRLKRTDTANPSLSLATANYVARQPNQNRSSNNRFTQNHHRPFGNNHNRNPPSSYHRSTWPSPRSNTHRFPDSAAPYCNYCVIPGHLTNECRKLAQFLKVTMCTSPPLNLLPPPILQQTWLLSTGPSLNLGYLTLVPHIMSLGM